MEKVKINKKGQALVSSEKMEDVLFFLKKSTVELNKMIEELEGFDLTKMTQKKFSQLIEVGLATPLKSLGMVTEEMRFGKDILHYLVPKSWAKSASRFKLDIDETNSDSEEFELEHKLKHPKKQTKSGLQIDLTTTRNRGCQTAVVEAPVTLPVPDPRLDLKLDMTTDCVLDPVNIFERGLANCKERKLKTVNITYDNSNRTFQFQESTVEALKKRYKMILGKFSQTPEIKNFSSSMCDLSKHPYIKVGKTHNKWYGPLYCSSLLDQYFFQLNDSNQIEGWTLMIDTNYMYVFEYSSNKRCGLYRTVSKTSYTDNCYFDYSGTVVVQRNLA